jgi:hypothetical protein
MWTSTTLGAMPAFRNAPPKSMTTLCLPSCAAMLAIVNTDVRAAVGDDRFSYSVLSCLCPPATSLVLNLRQVHVFKEHWWRDDGSILLCRKICSLYTVPDFIRLHLSQRIFRHWRCFVWSVTEGCFHCQSQCDLAISSYRLYIGKK